MFVRIAFWLTVILFSATGALCAQNTNRLYENNAKGVLYLGDQAPVIDGKFDDWQNLQGTSPKLFVYGTEEPAGDSQAFFILRSDNKKLYIYAEVVDDMPNENKLPAPLAWRNDSVEIYVGVNTAAHDKYSRDDNQIRIVPVSKTDVNAFDIAVNDRDVKRDCKAAVVYTDKGYTIEAAIPLRLLQIKSFQAGQAIRCEFQLNDGDKMERDVLTHWKSPKDDTYYQPLSWGDGVVVDLPKGQ